jgi:hypothetical protein
VLSGKLPVGFSKLTKLSGLFVQNNQLIGNIPKEYSTLIKLTYVQGARVGRHNLSHVCLTVFPTKKEFTSFSWVSTYETLA